MRRFFSFSLRAGLLLTALLAILGLPGPRLGAAPAERPPSLARCCVWKVSSPDGERTLFLAGSIHALRPGDYPLPAAYDYAFNASNRLAFEVEPEDMRRMGERLVNAGTLPRGVTLRDRVDPRTYAYLLRVLAKTHTPETQIASYQPWYLALRLESPSGGVRGLSLANGVERYLAAKAARAKKPITGLESWRAHADVFAAMSREEAEATLLLGFIKLDTAGPEFLRNVAAWRRGDADALEASMRASFQDYPVMYQRLITTRNQAWLPRVEGWLRGSGRGDTWLVVAGSAHFAGPGGLPELLRARGYRVQQL